MRAASDRPRRSPPPTLHASAAARACAFASTQSAIEWHIFYQLKAASLLLAVPGVIASTFALGALINALYGHQPGIAPEYAWPDSAGVMLGEWAMDGREEEVLSLEVCRLTID